MTYLPTMGALTADKFVNRSGICKPTDFPTLYIFQEMQYQLDRVAQGKGIAKIAPDGDIGPATLKLVGQTGPYMMVDAMSCPSVAASADMILAEAKKKADELGVPAKITVPATFKKPSIVAPSGAIVAAPPGPAMGAGASIVDTVKSLGTVPLVALGAGVVAIGYMLTKKRKGRK